MSRVKTGTYVALQWFMPRELNLKGNEMTVYGVIYGFSKEGKPFKGSIRYLADWCNVSKMTVINALKSLVNKKYILKKEIFSNGMKFCEYTINKEILLQLKVHDDGSQKSVGEVVKNSLKGSKESGHNNIYKNISNNISKSSSPLGDDGVITDMYDPNYDFGYIPKGKDF